MKFIFKYMLVHTQKRNSKLFLKSPKKFQSGSFLTEEQYSLWCTLESHAHTLLLCSSQRPSILFPWDALALWSSAEPIKHYRGRKKMLLHNLEGFQSRSWLHIQPGLGSSCNIIYNLIYSWNFYQHNSNTQNPHLL